MPHPRLKVHVRVDQVAQADGRLVELGRKVEAGDGYVLGVRSIHGSELARGRRKG